MKARMITADNHANVSTLRETYLAFGTPSFSEEEIEAVARVLRSGWVGMGPETAAFERELGDHTGAANVVTVNSCTSALFLALVASGVKAGDEVICPSLTWYSTANVALHLGAVPVFCDIDVPTLCVTPEAVKQRLTARTKAVMVVHIGGYAADVKAIREVVPSAVAIIEDAAHALGARYPDAQPVGSSGNLTCFSFYANKNLSTGDGGAIALQDAAVADRLRSLRHMGLANDAWKRFSDPRANVVPQLGELGYKLNYTDLLASIGRVQLRRQGQFNQRRRAIAHRYLEALPAVLPDIAFQRDVEHDAHARHLFVVVLPPKQTLWRDDLLMELRRRNVGAALHYAPLHEMVFYQHLKRGRLPVTETVCGRILTLPISGAMTDADTEYVIDQFADIVREQK